LTDGANADKKLSRRQFMGTAAAGAVMLGAVAGAKSLAPHITVAGKKMDIPVAAPALAAGIPSTWDYTADVVVVGNGGAGASSAISAYDSGATVLILEKAPKGLDGGNTGVSGGASGIFTPLTDMITIANMACYGLIPLDVVTAFCTQATALPAWLTSLGATTQLAPRTAGVPPSLYAAYVSPDLNMNNMTIAVPAFSYPTKTQPTGSMGWGSDLFAFLDNCRVSRGIPILYETPATQLIQNPLTREVIGVVATTWTGQGINVRANKGVILACGGYEYNPEMYSNFAAEQPRTEYQAFAGSPYNTGDGVTMAQQVGAKLWHMKKRDIPFLAAKVASQEIGVGVRLGSIGKGCSGATTKPIIYVNRKGQRFMNEYFSTGHQDSTEPYDDFFGGWQAVEGYDYCDWPNIPFYAIFDSTTMKSGPLPNDTKLSGYWVIHNLYSWSPDNSAELAQGWIVSADTPKDLGAKITCRDFYGNIVGMDPVGLDATVTAWNAACAAGVDNAFGRPAKTLHPFVTPPFYAVELCECPVNTDAGPARDKYSRTLGVNNMPIPRLYNAGELGSMWGVLYWGGGNVPEALGMGRVAGAHAAGLPSWI